MKKTDAAYKMWKRGCSIDTIAILLSVSEKTAKSYVRIGRSEQGKKDVLNNLSASIESVARRIDSRRALIHELLEHHKEINEMGRWGRFIMVLKGQY